MKTLKTLGVLLLISTSIFAQKKGQNNSHWTTLFDGKTFQNWHVYNKAGQPVAGKWLIENGAMVFTGKGKGEPHGDDLVSDKEYENFVLELEWKISDSGNSGIFYGVHEDPKFNVPYLTGPEIQVLDNERHPDAKEGKNGNRKAGSLYDMIPSASVSKSAGEWNMVKIEKNKGTVTVWQNGKLAETFPSEGAKWDEMVANSKFKGWEGFGKFSKGHIGLQDHGNMVSFKNIRIKEL